MVMYGRPWTNECLMCVRSTHAEVGRNGRAGRRKAHFGPVATRCVVGLVGLRGAIFGRWRAQKLRGGPNGEGGCYVSSPGAKKCTQSRIRPLSCRKKGWQSKRRSQEPDTGCLSRCAWLPRESTCRGPGGI